MRLIDADTLLKRKGCVYDSEGHVLFAVGTGDIVHAPTIDAIPVEWLERTRENYIAVATVLRMWHKEQEAR